jgi:hypothetical protein
MSRRPCRPWRASAVGPFEDALNSAVRAGLSRPPADGPFRMATRPLGLRSGIDLDKALQLAGQLEDEEIVRKLELRT